MSGFCSIKTKHSTTRHAKAHRPTNVSEWMGQQVPASSEYSNYFMSVGYQRLTRPS